MKRVRWCMVAFVTAAVVASSPTAASAAAHKCGKTSGNRVYSLNTNCNRAMSATHGLPNKWTASSAQVKIGGRLTSVVVLYPLAKTSGVFRAIKRPAASVRKLFKRRKLHGTPVVWYALG
ncbi:MAG: hypothetical protein JJE13_02590 [Thermoleophilia bacterium]|nr:hypothetical protein [Thermoleophilia bacterium]